MHSTASSRPDKSGHNAGEGNVPAPPSPCLAKSKPTPSLRKARAILKKAKQCAEIAPVNEIARLFLTGAFKLDSESEPTLELLIDCLHHFGRPDHAAFFRSSLEALPSSAPIQTPGPPLDSVSAPQDKPHSANDTTLTRTNGDWGQTVSIDPSSTAFPFKPGPFEIKLNQLVHDRHDMYRDILKEDVKPSWRSHEENASQINSQVRIYLNRSRPVTAAYHDEFTPPFDGYLLGRGFGPIDRFPSPEENSTQQLSAPQRLSLARARALTQSREYASKAVLARLELLAARLRLHVRERLERDVNEMSLRWRRSQDREESRKVALGRVHELIERIDGGIVVGARVFAFGSVTCGLALGDSDIDITVFIPGIPAADLDDGEDDFCSKDIRIRALRALERVAISMRMQAVTLVDRTRVPVLRYYDAVAKVEVDVTLGNESSILLSRLIRGHVSFDGRIWTLCMLVKNWAKNRAVCGAIGKFINPLGWVIMTIFFLQHVARPRVATLLHVRKPQRSTDDAAFARIFPVPWRSHIGDGCNRRPVSVLLSEMFHFFGHEFDFRNEIISLNLQRRTDVVEFLGRKSSSPLFIEQPLRARENVVSYVDHENMELTKHELRRAAELCRSSGDLDQILCPNYEN